MAGKLTVKQEKFVQGLFAGLSQREAYKQAYPSSLKWTDNAVDVKACQLAKTDKIAVRLNELQAEFKERNFISIERTLQEFARLGYYDPRKLFNEDGSLKEITDLDDDTAAVLAGLDVMEIYEGQGKDRHFVGYLKKYKLADKKGALDSIARCLGLFKDKSTVKISRDYEDMTDEELKTAIQRMERELDYINDKSQR